MRELRLLASSAGAAAAAAAVARDDDVAVWQEHCIVRVLVAGAGEVFCHLDLADDLVVLVEDRNAPAVCEVDAGWDGAARRTVVVAACAPGPVSDTGPHTVLWSGDRRMLRTSSATLVTVRRMLESARAG